MLHSYVLNNELLLRYSSHDLNNKTFKEQSILSHSNTKLICYSNPHCSILFSAAICYIQVITRAIFYYSVEIWIMDPEIGFLWIKYCFCPVLRCHKYSTNFVLHSNSYLNTTRLFVVGQKITEKHLKSREKVRNNKKVFWQAFGRV